MSEMRRPNGPATFTRLGLSRTELTAAIVAELEQTGHEPRPADIAAAVAGAIEANNEQLLRHLNQMLSSASDRSGPAARTRPTTPEAT